MGALSTLFGKKDKKKAFRRFCDLTGQPLEKDATYAITTIELISSRKFWDNKMTEPETMSYSQMHFNNQETGTNMRSIIFNKYSQQDKIWFVGEDQVNQFDINKEKALELGNAWLGSEGKVVPENVSTPLSKIASDQFDRIKHYAIMEAGKNRVIVS